MDMVCLSIFLDLHSSRLYSQGVGQRGGYLKRRAHTATEITQHVACSRKCWKFRQQVEVLPCQAVRSPSLLNIPSGKCPIVSNSHKRKQAQRGQEVVRMRQSNRGQTGLHSLCTKDGRLSAGSYESHHRECPGSSVPTWYVAGVSKGSTLYLASAHQAATSRAPIRVRPGRLRPHKLGDPMAQQQVCFLGSNI